MSDAHNPNEEYRFNSMRFPKSWTLFWPLPLFERLWVQDASTSDVGAATRTSANDIWCIPLWELWSLQGSSS